MTNLSKVFPVRQTLLGRLRGAPQLQVQALDGVSFAIAPNETLGIVGESGCGKSTLARCLVGLQPHTGGDILFRGRPLDALRSAERKAFREAVQMIFQDPIGSLNPRKTAGNAILEVLKVHGRAPGAERERVRALIDLVHLPPDALVRRPYQFSGGQRQRIGIARALAVEPQLLIADEAVSALDVSVQGQIVNLFLELQATLGLALIFISHDLGLVRHISRRVMVMYLGRVVETGPAQALFARPRHPYTFALRAALPSIRGTPGRRSSSVRGELPSPLHVPPGCAFHTRCPIARPVCRTERPALAAAGGDWPVACHFPDSLTSTAGAARDERRAASIN